MRNAMKPVFAAFAALAAAGALWGAGKSDAGKDGYSLEFDQARYTVKSSTYLGRTFSYRAYEGIVYVRHPVDAALQTLNIYVPAEYYEGKSSGAWNAAGAPVFLPNSVGGYMPGPAGGPGQGMDGGPNAALVALSKGFVVAAPGARGRTGVDAAGKYNGKAPACIVDLKAAVRYLRANDKRIPGDAEKIVSDGTSAGGALSALLAASGNSPDYDSYLKALGAAEARDDIFAAAVYCPIADLEHADMAYEWLFAGLDDYSKVVFQAPPQAAGAAPAGAPGAAGTMTPNGAFKRATVTGTMSAEQRALSAPLKALFPAYVDSLGLKGDSGEPLLLDAAGNGSFKDYVKSLVAASAAKALAAGADLSGLAWIAIKDGKVADLDFDQYLKHVGRMKTTAAFDAQDLGNAENELFGTPAVNARHFTQFGQDHSTVPAALAEASTVKLMNPLAYLGVPGADSAKFWRIRHGTADRDTSLAVSALLAAKASASGAAVDYALPWAVPHSGDYDLDELFAWMEKICR